MGNRRNSFFYGSRKSLPLVFSASFFGLIFGFTGATGDLPLYLISAMSYIIFAGSAQFIALVLIIKGEEMIAIIVTALILNLRHLLYGAVLHSYLKFKGFKRLILSYFLIDEAFLITSLAQKENEEGSIILDWVLLGSGGTLWVFWNIATILGYLIYQVTENILILPDNFVISASFFGFLLEHWVKFPSDRVIILVASMIAMILGFFFTTSIILISVMIGSALVAMYLFWRRSDDI